MSDVPCSIPECSMPISARGWCEKHYTRWRRTGTTDPGVTSPDRSAIQRYLEGISLGDDCWVWTKAISSTGYGHICLDGKRLAVHRWAYEYFVAPIPQGYTIDHLCMTKACARPDHLEAVTMRENVQRGAEHRYGRKRSDPNCRNGHPMSPENSLWEPTKLVPRCRECMKDYKRAYRAARKAAA